MHKLDDLLKLDKEHILDVIDAQPGQLRLPYADEMSADITATDGQGIANIVFAGMGGSALAGNIIRNWLFDRLTLPLEVIRGSVLPKYANSATLAIISSYSGTTAETLSAYESAKRAGCRILVLTGGGALLEASQRDGITSLLLPPVSQPRLAVFAGVRATACALEDMGVVAAASSSSSVDLRRELLDAADFLDIAKVALSSDNDQHNPALALANQLIGKPVLIYAGPLLASAAYKWKIDINEDAKQMAFYNTYSELCHNELEGWEFPRVKELACVQLSTPLESEASKARIAATTKLLQPKGYQPVEPEIVGSNHIQQLLYAILLGDFVSAYLGLINGIDPTQIKIVEQLKKDLS